LLSKLTAMPPNRSVLVPEFGSCPGIEERDAWQSNFFERTGQRVCGSQGINQLHPFSIAHELLFDVQLCSSLPGGSFVYFKIYS